MIVPYRVVWWDAPSLSYEEEISLGREIASKGKQPFVDEFLRSAGPIHNKKETFTKTQTTMSFVFLCLMALAIVVMGKGVIVLVAFSVVLAVYAGSVAVSTFRLNRWLNRLVTQYATHIAKRDFDVRANN